MWPSAWFADETFVHYDEHAEHIAAFVNGLLTEHPAGSVERRPPLPAPHARSAVSLAVTRPRSLDHADRPSPLDRLRNDTRPLAAAPHARGRRLHQLDVYEQERERIWWGDWVCTGRTEEIAEPGDYIVRDIAGESIFIARNPGR